MNGLPGKAGIFLACAMFLAGCKTGAEAVVLDLTDARASADTSDLAAVLAEAVDARGRLVPAGLVRTGDRLDAQLRKMALAGPTATPDLYPTFASAWAYWYNARAAWSMNLADLAGCPASRRQACPLSARRRPFRLDGRKMSLEEIDSILLSEARRSGDFRLAACAPGVWLDYAPMPDKPFSADHFAGRLAEALGRLVLDDRRFVIDVQGRQVRIPPMLWACRNMVISLYHGRYGPCRVSLTTALRPHLNRAARRRLENALGYAVVRQRPRAELAIPKRRIFYPGKIGKIEP